MLTSGHRDAPTALVEWRQLFPTIFGGSWARANGDKPDIDLCSQPLQDALLCLVSQRHSDDCVRAIFPRLYWSLTKQASSLKLAWPSGSMPRGFLRSSPSLSSAYQVGHTGKSHRESFDILVAFIIGTIFYAAPENPDYFLKPARIFAMLDQDSVLTQSPLEVQKGVFSYQGERDDPTAVQWWRLWLWLVATMLTCSTKTPIPKEFWDRPAWTARRTLLEIPREHREPSDTPLLAYIDFIRGWDWLKGDWQSKGFDLQRPKEFWNRDRRCNDFINSWEASYRARLDAFKSRYSAIPSFTGVVKAVDMSVACVDPALS